MSKLTQDRIIRLIAEARFNNSKPKELAATIYSAHEQEVKELEKIIEGYKSAADSIHEDKSFTEHENLRHK